MIGLNSALVIVASELLAPCGYPVDAWRRPGRRPWRIDPILESLVGPEERGSVHDVLFILARDARRVVPSRSNQVRSRHSFAESRLPLSARGILPDVPRVSVPKLSERRSLTFLPRTPFFLSLRRRRPRPI